MRVSSPVPSPTPHLAPPHHLPDAVEQRRLCREQHRIHAHDKGEGVRGGEVGEDLAGQEGGGGGGEGEGEGGG